METAEMAQELGGTGWGQGIINKNAELIQQKSKALLPSLYR